MVLDKLKNITNYIRKNKLLQIQLIVIIFCLIIGTLLHFTYNWSGENQFIATISSVNESVWEHLKLVFYPMLFAGIMEYFFVKDITNNYLEAKTIGIFGAISFIVIVYFTYTGILGTNLFLIDILTFIASIVIGEWISYKLMKRENESTNTSKILATVILVFLTLSFIICTFCPPRVNLFKSPNNGMYGVDIAKNKRILYNNHKS